jgi:hypothetical protein
MKDFELHRLKTTSALSGVDVHHCLKVGVSPKTDLHSKTVRQLSPRAPYPLRFAGQALPL